MQSEASSSERSSESPRRKIALGGGIIVLCLVAFALATVLALRQAPRSDPFSPLTLGEKIFSPQERNAFLRLPVVSGQLNSVFVVPGSGHIWVAGNSGLLLVSEDKGATWQQRTVAKVKPPQPQLTPPSAPSIFKLKSGLSPLTWLVPDALAARPAGQSYDAGNAPPNVRQQLPNAPSAVEKDVKNLPAIHAPSQRQEPVEIQKPSPTPAEKEIQPHLQSIYFNDSRNGWIVGQAGALYKTTDGGATWALIASGSQADLYCIAFTDPGHGQIWGANTTVLVTADGGATWSRRVRYDQPVPELYFVHFFEARRGWALAKDRSLFYSNDGGEHWNRRGSQPKAPLNAIHFTTDEMGWAVGLDGMIFATQDGAKTWTPLYSGTQETLHSVYFSDRAHGWIVGANGALLRTADGGATWRRQSRGDYLSSVFFTDDSFGWAAGQNGRIMKSTDGGRSWLPIESGTKEVLRTVKFVDHMRGLAVGENGTILKTINGGKIWNQHQSGEKLSFSAAYFIDLDYGWAGRGTRIYTTIDGGETWKPQWTGAQSLFSSIFFVDRNFGWAVTGGVEYGGRIFGTKDGGGTWTPNNTGSKRLESIFFIDRDVGWVVGASGTILFTTDGSKTWNKQASETDAGLRSIYFLNQNLGWVTGESGIILSTANSGATWTQQPSGTKASLSSVFFSDPQHGWASGDGGTLLFTTDGGQSWNTPAYSRRPALWYWLVCLLLAGLSFFVMQRRGRPEMFTETVADMLASDRPLTANDPDPLDLHSISAGLARFIANRNTDPPLTIAVTGEWGTGKSSLMNLLYHDLKKRRFQPVWFNAWHHQKGEQLLASLYAHIQRQAVPPLFHPAGILFRLRLLLRRSRRNWLAFLAVVALGLAVYPYLEGTLFALAGAVADLAKAFLSGSKQNVRNALDLSALFKAIPNHLDKLMAAILASPAVAAVLRAIRSFGLSPQSLIAFGAADSPKKSDMDPGARARFAQEFNDVAASLDLGAMVLFIDDLDRCSKENVVEILETINFLTVSGRCFIILGMARQWVETCVALQFKELAEESDTDDDDKNGHVHRRRFAQQYLEKLINIEVPIPVPASDKTLALLAPNLPPPATRLQWIKSTLSKEIIKYLPFLCVALLALAAWGLKDWFMPTPAAPQPAPQEVRVLPGPSNQGELLLQDGKIRLPLNTDIDPKAGRALEVILKSPAQSLEKGIAIGTLGSGEQGAELVLRYRPQSTAPSASQTAESDQKPEPTPAEEKKSAETAFFQASPGQSGWAGLGWSLLAGLCLAVIGVFYLLQRPQRFTSDSQTFRDALVIWHPWIIFISRTPRTIKRFLNRLRYVAMRLQPMAPPHPVWQKFKNRLKGQDQEQQAEPIPGQGLEPIWVALGAIFHVHPAWLKDAASISQLFTTDALAMAALLEKEFPAIMERSEAAAALVAAIASFKQTFHKDAMDLMQQRERFLEVLAETGR